MNISNRQRSPTVHICYRAMSFQQLNDHSYPFTSCLPSVYLVLESLHNIFLHLRLSLMKNQNRSFHIFVFMKL